VVLGGLVAPLALVSLPGRYLIGRACLASALVVVAMWVKRYLIILVPGVTEPISPLALYRPTWVELTITAGAVAAIPLGLMVLFALVPVMSVHELEEVEEIEPEPAPLPRLARRAIAPAFGDGDD
jgi:molybdopterin-containing oxidoreductase family membrane subunit